MSTPDPTTSQSGGTAVAPDLNTLTGITAFHAVVTGLAPTVPAELKVPVLPVREAPAPEPLHSGLTDPAHTIVLNEPVLDVDNIQGNILGGFNKDFQTFLFLKITDPASFRHWLHGQIPFVATSAEVIAFNRLFKAIRFRRKRENSTVRATWFNLALSYAGLKKLQSVIPNLLATDFADQAFKDGLAKRSASLGDPTDPTADGHPNNWCVGGTNNEADVILQIASDTRDDLTSEISRIEDSLYVARDENGKRIHSGAQIIFKQNGANLPGQLGGHEHFGFLDGVSQPGVRGLLSSDKHDVLTLRQNPQARDVVPPGETKKVPAQGKPGQDLLWPGEFVFGYPRQNGQENASWEGPNAEPGPDSLTQSGPHGGKAAPDWARNGAFLVFRRLRQDVNAFHTFLNTQAGTLGVAPGHLGATLVGRWASGDPVVRFTDADHARVANNDSANNHFEFGDPSDPIPLAPASDPFACMDMVMPQSPGDKAGLRCPFTAHIRKAYPRDDEPLAGVPTDINESTTQTHRLLRRGIPFGEASASTPERPIADSGDRGLLFFAYQTSIERQFEFVTNAWVNNPDFKEPDGTNATPPQNRGGHDPILGQNNKVPNRQREFTAINSQNHAVRLTTTQDWVIPTGGGYFFAPSLDALQNLLSQKP